MKSKVSLIFRLFISYCVFFIVNNLFLNTVSYFIGYNFFYTIGIVCDLTSINKSGKIIIILFTLFKFIIYLLYYKYNYRVLKYYLICEFLILIALIFDDIFNINIIKYFYSNRPIYVLSLFIFNNYLIQIILSILSILLLYYKKTITNIAYTQ